MFTVVVPTTEELHQANRFRTYLNYLRALAEYIEASHADPLALVKTIVRTKAFQDIQGGRCADLDMVGRLFRNSWFTEVQLTIPLEYQEFIAYTNHWAPVQAYYAVYLSLRAYFLSKGHVISGEHATTLKAISEEIPQRPDLFPYPWKLSCIGDPANDTFSFVHLPGDVTISRISSLTSNTSTNFWDIYGLFLKTTRDRQIRQKCTDWKKGHNKSRISGKVRSTFAANLSPTTLFNCLYRLRLRSNYVDADSFILASQGSEEGSHFNAAMRNISWYSLLVLELLSIRQLGKAKFDSIVASFKKYESSGKSTPLICQRWDLIKSIL